MFTTPSLAETIRATNNRNRFKQQFGLQNQPVDWNQAEQAVGAMQAPREAAPAVAPFAAATQVDPMTGRRGYKPGYGPGPGVGVPGYYGHGLQRQPPPMGYGSAPGITPDQPAQGGGGGGGTGAARNPRGQGADPFDPRSKFDKGKGLFMAEGGEVDGPGGPKDDLVPAMLSDGEYIMPAEAVKFFGLDKLNKMKEKAREGMLEVESGKSKGGSNFQPPASHFPLSPIPHMAEGGLMEKAGRFARGVIDYNTGGFQNLADAAALIPKGIGYMADDLSGSFMRGFTPAPDTYVDPREYAATQPAPVPAERPMVPMETLQGLQKPGLLSPPPMFNTPPAPTDPTVDFMPPTIGHAPNPGVPIPDFSGPATAPAPTIEDMRFRGLAARANLDNARAGNARPFLAPWEKDAMARAEREAALPQFPGMNRTQSRRFAASPQGQAVLASDRAGQMQAVNDRQKQQDAHNEWLFQHQLTNEAGMNRDALKTEQSMAVSKYANDLAKERDEARIKAGAAASKETLDEKQRRASTVIKLDDEHSVTASGTLFRHATGKVQASITPDEAAKLGLEPYSSDGKSVTYRKASAPKSPDEPVRTTQDQMTGEWINHYRDGTFAPAQARGTGAAPAGADPNKVEELRKKYNY